MTQQEIISGNLLIAEFMGVKLGVEQYSWRIGCLELLKEEHLNYHESWGWLMPVILKIGEYRYADDHNDYAFPRTFGMKDDDGNYLFRFNRSILFASTELIDAAYIACIDFIKWYNTNKSI